MGNPIYRISSSDLILLNESYASQYIIFNEEVYSLLNGFLVKWNNDFSAYSEITQIPTLFIDSLRGVLVHEDTIWFCGLGVRGLASWTESGGFITYTSGSNVTYLNMCFYYGELYISNGKGLIKMIDNFNVHVQITNASYTNLMSPIVCNNYLYYLDWNFMNSNVPILYRYDYSVNLLVVANSANYTLETVFSPTLFIENNRLFLLSSLNVLRLDENIWTRIIDHDFLEADSSNFLTKKEDYWYTINMNALWRMKITQDNLSSGWTHVAPEIKDSTKNLSSLFNYKDNIYVISNSLKIWNNALASPTKDIWINNHTINPINRGDLFVEFLFDNNLNDTSGNNHIIQTSTDPYYFSDSIEGQSVYFKNTLRDRFYFYTEGSSYTSILSNDFTLNFWFKTNGSFDPVDLYEFSDSDDDSDYRLYIDINDTLYISMGAGTVGINGYDWVELMYFELDRNYRDNNWHFCCMRFSKINEQINIYIDNETFTEPLTTINTNLTDFILGQTLLNPWSNSGESHLDSLRLWRRSLSDEEVELLKGKIETILPYSYEKTRIRNLKQISSLNSDIIKPYSQWTIYPDSPIEVQNYTYQFIYDNAGIIQLTVSNYGFYIGDTGYLGTYLNIMASSDVKTYYLINEIWIYQNSNSLALQFAPGNFESIEDSWFPVSSHSIWYMNTREIITPKIEFGGLQGSIKARNIKTIGASIPNDSTELYHEVGVHDSEYTYDFYYNGNHIEYTMEIDVAWGYTYIIYGARPELKINGITMTYISHLIKFFFTTGAGIEFSFKLEGNLFKVYTLARMASPSEPTATWHLISTHDVSGYIKNTRVNL